MDFGNAEELPLEDGSFDCVISQFGMMFFQDLQQARVAAYHASYAWKR
ncbi:class I SAM-dependent methyltransferase [uncultured Ruegeria sp.]